MLNENVSFTNKMIRHFDNALRTIFNVIPAASRENPAHHSINSKLSEPEQQQSARLMRVNHCGEVCAQALYQGQALVSRNPVIKEKLAQAAIEENDHLNWCANRINELGSHTSYLNPVWYAGSLFLGVVAGCAGDAWNLGFLAETEKQVVKHLETHLQQMSLHDYKSRKIIEQMRDDEMKHATVAMEAGAKELPEVIKKLMALTSKIMTKTSYWV